MAFCVWLRFLNENEYLKASNCTKKYSSIVFQVGIALGWNYIFVYNTCIIIETMNIPGFNY